MKICLVRPPSIINPAAFIGTLTPPLGLAYLAAALVKAGHETIIIDGIGEDPMRATKIDEHLVLRGLTLPDIVERIPADCDLVGFSGMFSSEWRHYRELINLIGSKLRDQYFVAGGEHFSAAPELSLDQCPRLDAIVLGEGEETMVDLLAAIATKRDLLTVAGLVLRSPAGHARTGARGRIRRIDDIPEPAWHLVPVENYLANHLGFGVDRGRSMPVLASRGCPYQCTFCSNPQMWGTRWVARHPKQVVDEIERCVRTYNVTNVDFFDLTAIVKRQWILDFCREMVARNLDITWQLPSGTRSEAIDGEVAKWLRRSGCRNLSYAPESGSERSLELIKKRVKLDRLTQSMVGVIAEGVNVKLNIIIGFPHETHRDIHKTLSFLVKMAWHGAHDVSVGVFAPYPGSELYDALVAEGRISNSDDFFDKLAYVDITDSVSYSEHLSSAWIRFYNWLAFAIFYGANYAFRPWRFARSCLNILRNQHQSRGEMALAQLFSRLRVTRP
jgi:anaerobic magnesium-protoporphyrin IX monomethyl ester cyclase